LQNLGTHQRNVADASQKGQLPHGTRHHFGRLTDDQVRRMRERYANGGTSHRLLALEYGIRPGTARAIINRKTYKHVS